MMVQADNLPDLVRLPDEILNLIFQNLDASSLLNVGVTARRFRPLSNEQLQWKRFCETEFRYWDDRKAFRQQLNDGVSRDWKVRYSERRRLARNTENLLDDIIHDARGRSNKILGIVNLGYGAKDTLLRAFKESPSSPNHLAQRYWSHVALGCLHRSVALKQWTEVKLGNIHENPTEHALAAFDMFILDQHDKGDINDIFDGLDHYVRQVRAAYPDLDEQTPRTKAMTIASYLRERRWIGLDRGREYHSLDNMFLGVALFSPHNNSLPLISSVIYSYVARQFGLRAQPISYPMHVYVLIQSAGDVDMDGHSLPPDEQPTTNEPSSKTHLYMDPFNGIEPIPLSTLQANLRFIVPAATTTHTNSYLSAATHRDLLIRTAYNILNTRTADNPTPSHPISIESAMYAAFFALVFFPTHPATLRTHLTELTQHFLHHYDHDIHTFRSYILPQTLRLPDHLAYRNLSLQLEHNDAEAPVPKLRTPETQVTYRVGQLFRHRRRNYTALIYGWDHVCDMPQQWISMNQVDRLPKGRNQPFYNVLVLDDRSTRYVAQENVVLLGPESEGGNGQVVTMAEVEAWPIEVGKWMKRFVADERGVGWRFVSNVRDQYPED